MPYARDDPLPPWAEAASARWIMAPDNEASTGSVGFLLKFARQTRIGGDLSLAAPWTQNAPFYPYTINSAVLTPTGARADSLSTLPQPSFNGKINTTTYEPRRSRRGRWRGWASARSTGATT